MGYKRYGSSDSIPTFNDDNKGEAVSNGILKNSSNKEIYFGIKKPKSAADSDKPWRELTTDDFDTQITSETGGCSATITKNNNDTTNKTGIIRYILSKNTTGSTRLITFKYNGTALFQINQTANVISETKPIEFEITAGFIVEERLLDNTSDYYDIYVSAASLTLSCQLPFRLDVCVNIIYDSTLNDGTIDVQGQIASHNWYFDANTTVGKSSDGMYKPTVIMNKGNGRYGFHSIDFLSSINTDHQSVGPGSNDYPTDEYADIKYENKIYRCKTINFPDNMEY